MNKEKKIVKVEITFDDGSTECLEGADAKKWGDEYNKAFPDD